MPLRGGLMKRSSGPRKPAILSESVNRRLNRYALAASAAGVGLLAFSVPAEGKVIYTAIHHVIPERARFQLDLDHDKNIDFAISNRVTCGDSGCWYSLALNPVKGNAGLGHHFSPFYFPFAWALKTGARIGHGANCLSKVSSKWLLPITVAAKAGVLSAGCGSM